MVGAEYELIFRASPTPYLLLDPKFKIVAVNDAYLRATMTSREQLLGRSIFAAFPDNPNDPHATGVQNLRASLKRAIATGAPDIMPVQKYDIPRPEGSAGEFEERYWSPINTPILADDGTLLYLLHRVEDVTMLLKRDAPTDDTQLLKLELVERAQEIELRNRELQREYQRQKEVASLASEALAGASAEALMQRAAEIVQSCTESDFSSVMEALPGGEGLIVRAGVGWGPEIVAREKVPGGADSQSGYTMKVGHPVMVEEVSAETRFKIAPLLIRYGVNSVITVTIPGILRPFGVLSVSSRQRRRFTAIEVQFLQSTAHVLGAAFELAWSRETQTLVLRHQLATQEEERQRIGREIHDDSGQLLTALTLGLSMIEESHDIEYARKQAGQLHSIAASILANLSRMARGLHPAVLDELGLTSALEAYIDEYRATCGIDVAFDSSKWDHQRIDRDRQVAIYRIVQEALNNISKHSGARRARVALAMQDGAARLTVEDDGKGFRVDEALRSSDRGRLGIHGMRERAALFGGNLRIESEESKGTKIELEIALRDTQPSGMKSS
jgi:signal transduction histidine kinase